MANATQEVLEAVKAIEALEAEERYEALHSHQIAEERAESERRRRDAAWARSFGNATANAMGSWQTRPGL